MEVPTLKEAPSEAEVPSHIFMVRGGYLRKVAAGIYSFLPLGWRVVQKVERIIRQEMDRSGASEVFLPAVIPGELWKESGRWQNYGDQLLRFKDRKELSQAVWQIVADGASTLRQNRPAQPLNLPKPAPEPPSSQPILA